MQTTARNALVIVLGLLLCAWGGLKFWASWGTVTLDVQGAPLGEVVRQIEKQGKIAVSTTLDPETKVTLRLKRALPADAVDRLAASVGARWKLCFALAPQKAGVSGAFAVWEKSGETPGLKQIEARLPGMFGAGEETFDPRRDPWKPKAPVGAPLSEWLADAAKQVDAAFWVPESWDPPVSKAPTGTGASAMIGALAKALGAVREEVFLIEAARGFGGGTGGEGRGRRGEEGGRQASGEGGPGGEWRGPRAMADPATVEAIERRIERLPEAERAAVRERFARFRDLAAEAQNLPPEERRERFRELFSDPVLQAQMEERRAVQDSRSSPEQRADRYRRYIERKEAQK